MIPLAAAAPADLGGWFHPLSPHALRITDAFSIRWYGLSYVAGFLIAWLVLRELARRGLVAIPRERVSDAVLIAIAGIVIGGRLGYVLFYQPSLLWDVSPAFPWWGLLTINKGGMASHGGMIGLVVASWYISRGFKDESGTRVGRCPPAHVMDTMALLSPFGLLLGRLANFVNGELLGRVVAMPGEPAPRWAVRFPQEVLTDHAPALTPEQEQQLREVVSRVAIPGEPFYVSYERLLERIQSGAPDLAARLEPLISARHPSQLYQAAAEGVVVGGVIWFVFRKPRVPGVVGSWFLISYGMLRITTEFWRLPDAHLEAARVLGLSRGQWLSALMVLAGIVVLAVVTRRDGPRYGGWLKGSG